MTLLPHPRKGRQKRAGRRNSLAKLRQILGKPRPRMMPSRPQRRQNRGGCRFHPSPRQRGRGTARCAVEGARASPSSPSMKMKRRVRSPLHHPAFATLTTGGPPPPLSRGRKASASVLAARFSSHPSHRRMIPKSGRRFSGRIMRKKAISKTTPATRPSSDAPGSGNRRMHHDRRRRTVARIERSEIRGRSRGFYRRSRVSLRSTRPTKSFQTRFRQQKEAERRQTRVSLLHLPAKRAPWPGRARLSAFHCSSRQGDSWSPRLSVRPCFPGQSGAFDPVRPLQPGSGDLALRHA